MVESFRRGDERLLLPPLQKVQASTDAEYVMVLGPDGRVLAHTNVVEKDKVYRDDASRRAIDAFNGDVALVPLSHRPDQTRSPPVARAVERHIHPYPPGRPTAGAVSSSL